MTKIKKPQVDPRLQNLPPADYKTVVHVALDATIAQADDLLNAAQKMAKQEGCVWFRAVFLGPGLGFRLEGWHKKPDNASDARIIS